MGEHERSYYEQAEMWDHYVSVGEADEMADAVARLIPDGVRSILDVGCGSGVISDRLAGTYDMFAGDRSRAALAHVRAPSVQLDAAQLPFANESVDLVLSTDVLEHLPGPVWEGFIAECARVARQYVLLIVPNREPMAHFSIRCWSCGTSYHAHHHVRTHDSASFDGVPGFGRVAVAELGSRWPVVETAGSGYLSSFTGGYPNPLAVCPTCGAGHRVDEDQPGVARLRRQIEAIQHAAAETSVYPWPHRSELAVLLERGHVTSDRDDTPVEMPAPEVEEFVRLCARPPRSRTEVFATEWEWVAEPGRAVVIFPRLPSSLSIVAGDVDRVHVYDHVDAEYIEAPMTAPGVFDLPSSSPDLIGYRVALESAQPATIEIRCVYDQPARLASEIAFAPSARWTMLGRKLRQAEEELVQKQAVIEQLSRDVASLNVRIDSLYEQLQTVAAERSALNDLANDIERRRADAEERLADLLGGRRGE
jgi:SAM-dependent methyltransferase